jgi:hypothetical protein
MKQTTITRRTTFGYDYNCFIQNNERGQWYIPIPGKPHYVGTFKQVCKQIDDDTNLASFKSSGTFYSDAWFVKIKAKWYRIVKNANWMYQDLRYEKSFMIDYEE